MNTIIKQIMMIVLVMTFSLSIINCGATGTTTGSDDSSSGGSATGEATSGGDSSSDDTYTEATGTDEGEETEENTTVPTIKSLVDADSISLSQTASKNTTLISAKTTNTFKVTFSESMDITSINTDNISVECDGKDQAITSIKADSKGSDDIADNEFIITMKSQLPQYTECDMVFTSDIGDLDDTDLEETTYTFTTACASSDTFNDSDVFDACWDVDNISSSASVSFSDNLVMNFTSVSSSDKTNIPFIYKLVEGDFEAVIHVSKRNSDEGTEEIGLAVSTETPAIWGDSVHIGLYYSAGFGDENTYSNHYKNDAVQSIATATTYTAKEIYLKVTRTGNNYTTYYSSDGSTWTKDGDFTNVTNIGQTASVGVFGATGNTKGDYAVTIDSFTFNSGSAIDQD
ncbi:MAG: Ig-like domain-containing protein [bacterium]